MTNAIRSFRIDGTTSVATFRLWGSSISTMISDMGFVKTSDTGQVDWATVALPSNFNTIWCYEIWRFNDSLQGTTPIFFKIGYGRASGPGTVFLSIEGGSGSNGSGTITGIGAGLIYYPLIYGGVADNANPKTHLVSSDGSGLFLVHGIDAATAGHKGGFLIERLRNNDGTPNGDGFIIRAFDGTLSVLRVYDRINNLAYNATGGNAIMPFSLTSGQSTIQSNGQFPTSPVHVFTPGVSITRSKMILCYAAADLGLHAKQQVYHQGQLRTYNCLGIYFGGQDSALQAPVSFAMWWND